MQRLNLTLEPQTDLPNTAIAYFQGDFDGSAEGSLTELSEWVSGCAPNSTLICDFRQLNFLNSYAIGHLIQWHNQLQEKKGKILIAGANKNVEDIFAIVGIRNIFKMFPDLPAALGSLKNPTS